MFSGHVKKSVAHLVPDDTATDASREQGPALSVLLLWLAVEVLCNSKVAVILSFLSQRENLKLFSPPYLVLLTMSFEL